jgi:hypothetical protein
MVVLLALIGTLSTPGTSADTLAPEAPCLAAGVDADGDGLSDDCEDALLRRFAPTFVASPMACNWDAASGRLKGGYLVGAEPVEGGIRLAYLPAYLEDCGWAGLECLLRPRGGCDPHHGDSEAVFVDLVADAPVHDWHPERVFLSAHCFSRSDGRCRWFDREEVQWFGSTSVIWVAEGKNANYPSKGACDSGHWGFDTCDRNARRFRFPVVSARQNIGTFERRFPHRADPSGCVARPELVEESDAAEGRECVWSDETFGGWSGLDEGTSTGYRRYLKDIAGFIPGGAGTDDARRPG